VVATDTGRRLPSARAARSWRASVSVSSPYPDLISMPVTPSAISASSRGSACSNSSASVAARVALTVERMPPPARAISS
jgi:hypothetical protein